MLKALPALLLGIFLSGCATIVNHRYSPMTVNTSPSGASVYVDGEYVGQSPVTHMVDRSLKDRYVEVKRLGYQPNARTVEPEIGVGYLLVDVLFLTPIAAIVDLLSKHAFSVPATVDLAMERLDK